MGDASDDLTPGDHEPSLSQILRRLVDGDSDRIAIGDLVDAFGPRAFGALMFVFAVPAMILPAGLAGAMAVPLFIIACQVAVGLPNLWLPRLIDRRGLRRSSLKAAFGKVLPRLERLERGLRPRLEFLFGPVGDRVLGVACTLLTLVLILPIPFGNYAPAAAIAALGLGLTQRDGIVVLVGYGIALASVVVLILSAQAVMAAFAQVMRLLGV